MRALCGLALVFACLASVGTPPAVAAKRHRHKHRAHHSHPHKPKQRPKPIPAPVPHPQAAWAPAGSKPLSDTAAAALVTHAPETRPDNTAANEYAPSDSELATARATPNEYGVRADVANPHLVSVTGRPGLHAPSTDDLIQWAAHKWGIPEDVIRAQAVVETDWHQAGLGDRTTVSPAWYAQYPPQAQVPGTSDVFQSMGLMQIRWLPDGGDDTGSEPLRWKSTAYNVDYYAATVRWYYDGLCGWCTAGYGPGQDWNSIGAWNSPYPWDNQHARDYIAAVKQRLAERTWAQPEF